MKSVDKELINAWLYKGKEDLLFAKAAFKDLRMNFYDQICCLCQQAVEKYLKAVILIKKGKITKEDKTHNLNVLAKKCKPLIDLSQFKKELRMLTAAYIPARYPNESYFKVFSRQEAQESLAAAERIISFIEERLNKILK